MGNPMLEVEPTGQRGRAAGSSRKGNSAVDGAATEEFARWLHRRYASVELPSAWAWRFAVRYPVNY